MNERLIFNRNEIIDEIIAYEMRLLIPEKRFIVTYDHQATPMFTTFNVSAASVDNSIDVAPLCEISISNDVQHIPHITVEEVSYNKRTVVKYTCSNANYTEFRIEADDECTAIYSTLPIDQVLRNLKDGRYHVVVRTDGEHIDDISTIIKMIRVSIDDEPAKFSLL